MMGHNQQHLKEAEGMNQKGLVQDKKVKQQYQLQADNLSTHWLEPQEMQHLKDHGRCFHCKRKGHKSQQCPRKQGRQHSSSPTGDDDGTDNEDLRTVVEEPSQTWKENGYGNVHVTRQGHDGQQEWAKYIRFETMEGEPMVYGIMDNDETIHEEPLRAAPCYDTFPFPTPIEGSYQNFLNAHNFNQTAIKEVEALGDCGILAEVYQYKRYELEETSIRHEEVQERLALDMKKRWRLIQRRVLEAKKHEVIQKLKEAKVQGCLLEQRYRKEERIDRRPEPIKKERRSIAVQTVKTHMCQYCGKTGHGSVVCPQPHFHCTKLRGCQVEDTHPWFYPRT